MSVGRAYCSLPAADKKESFISKRIMTKKLRNVPFSPPDMTEAEAGEVRDAILSGWITTGPRTKQLEREVAAFTGAARSVCLNSQTACGEMALRLLGIGEGDEVIVPAYTYTASASVVEHVGARLVMVDVLPDRPELDYDAVAAAVTSRTKAVIPVDLAGIPCDYDRLFRIAEEKKSLFTPKTDLQRKMGRMAICCDAAHAFGASRGGRMVGCIADFSSFSFHAVKNFTTAEGGALTWNLPFGEEPAEKDLDNDPRNPLCGVPFIEGETWNDRLYRVCQLLSLHGQNKDALAKTRLGAWEYDIIGPWYKCNMTDVAAAIGLVQMKRYPALLARRRRMIERYDEAFRDLDVCVLRHYTEAYESSGHLYLVRLCGRSREETDGVIERMAGRGIATNVHYKPLPMMTAYRRLGFDIGDYPHAYRLFENEITLPLNTRMTDEDQEYVIRNFVEIVKAL